MGRANPLVAVEFLTVLRLRRRDAPFDAASFAAAQGYYPLVGLLIGAAAGLLWLALDWALPRPPATALAVVALAGLTGGLHLDGLADTADGLFGGGDRARRLAIMRDSRTGSFGALAIAAVLLLKWAALLGMTHRGAVFAALLVAPALARGAMVVAAGRYPYARPEGMGAGFHEAARGRGGLAAAGTAVVAGAAVYGGMGAALAAGALLASAVVARYPYTRLGGLTGDVYGALVETIEVAVLLAASSGAERGWLNPYLWGG